MSFISYALKLVTRDPDILESSVVDRLQGRFDTVQLPPATVSRPQPPQPGNDRTDQGAPSGAISNLRLLALGTLSGDALSRLILEARARGPNGLKGPDALFDTYTICISPVSATVDQIPRPASKTLAAPIFPIEPAAEGVAMASPIHGVSYRIDLSR